MPPGDPVTGEAGGRQGYVVPLADFEAQYTAAASASTRPILRVSITGKVAEIQPVFRSYIQDYMMLQLFMAIQKVLMGKGWVLLKTMRLLERKRALNFEVKPQDFARYSSLELCAFEINARGLKGSIAEVGVFQGDFASQMNVVFPDNKFYLFDTFEGFDQRDIDVELAKNYNEGKQDFSFTSVDAVLNRMQNRSRCEVRKGYFPETATGIDEPFVFVSLDADLFKPIYDGLCFFHPKLVKGGYIFVHDYNNDQYKGAQEAVRRFCTENAVSFFPLSDICGTAVICK